MSLDTIPVGPINREIYKAGMFRRDDAVLYELPGGSEFVVEIEEDGWITGSWANALPEDQLLVAIAYLYRGEINIDDFKYKIDDDDFGHEIETQEDFDKFMGSPYSFLLSLKNNPEVEIAWEDGEFEVSSRKIEDIRELIDLTASDELRERIDGVLPSGN